MSQVVTELVINADTRGADQYAAAMDKASAALQRSAGAGSLIPQLSTMTLSVGGGALAIAGLLDVVGKLNRGLAEMGEAAKRAGLDVEKFQQLQFAGGITGLSSKDFAAGAEAMAMRLSDASRNVNELSRLLDANNVKFKDSNGLLIDTNKLFTIAADLLHRAATEQDKIKMAEMLGLTRQWVPMLDKGAQAFADTQKEATALGLVINKDIIAKAADFDAEWRKSSEVFSLWLKAKLADLLPLIDDLIGRAQRLGSEIMAAFSAATSSPQGQEALQNIRRASEIMADESLGTATERAIVAGKALAGTLQEATKALLDQRIAGKDTAKMWDDIAAGMENAAAAAKKQAAAMASAGGGDSGPRSVVPAKDVAKDALDRQIDTINKQIAVMGADAKAVGLSAGAHDELRAKAQLLEAAERAGIPVTSAWTEQFDKLAAKAGAAAQALAKAKVEGDISFGRQTALLDSGDVAVAQQLRHLYGNDVPAALASTEAAALRMNDAMRGVSNQISTGLTTALTDIVTGSKSAQDAFRNLGLVVVRAIDEMIIKLLIVQPLMRGLQGAMGGGGGFLGLPLGGATGGAAPTGVVGSAGDMVVPTFLHDGGIVGAGGTQRGAYPRAMFEAAPRYHMGVDEVPAVLQRGERVIPRGASNNTPQPITISVDVSGANGDAEIERRVNAGVQKGMQQVLAQVPGIAVTSVSKARSNNPNLLRN